jgi:hypothetical protein
MNNDTMIHQAAKLVSDRGLAVWTIRHENGRSSLGMGFPSFERAERACRIAASYAARYANGASFSIVDAAGEVLSEIK